MVELDAGHKVLANAKDLDWAGAQAILGALYARLAREGKIGTHWGNLSVVRTEVSGNAVRTVRILLREATADDESP